MPGRCPRARWSSARGRRSSPWRRRARVSAARARRSRVRWFPSWPALAIPRESLPASGRLARAMIDHICLVVRDYAKSKAFYTRALAPLGAELAMEFGVYGGFGQNKKPSFWIGGGPPSYWDTTHKSGASPMHIAFVAKDRATVDAFYAAAMAAGA